MPPRSRSSEPVDCTHPNTFHAHGTRNAYVLDKCGCQPCREAAVAYEAVRSRQHLYGRFNGLVDAEPARQHVRELMAAGVGLKTITKHSGVYGGVLNKLMYGGGFNKDGAKRGPVRRIKPANAAALLAVTPEHIAGGAHVDATGTNRRIQALVAIGWSQSQLGDRLGIMRANFRLATCDQVTERTAAAVRELYDLLWDVLPPRNTHHRRQAYSRTINYARSHNWAPPLAWDDIDHDTAPALDEDQVDELALDEIKVERIAAGTYLVPANSKGSDNAELYEAVRRLVQLGLKDSEIGQRVSRSSDAVLKIRRRNTIPRNLERSA